MADLIGQGRCHLGDVEVSMLGEAGQMAGLGFLPQVGRLLGATPPEGQRLLFSAALDGEADVLARRFLPVQCGTTWMPSGCPLDRPLPAHRPAARPGGRRR